VNAGWRGGERDRFWGPSVVFDATASRGELLSRLSERWWKSATWLLYISSSANVSSITLRTCKSDANNDENLGQFYLLDALNGWWRGLTTTRPARAVPSCLDPIELTQHQPHPVHRNNGGSIRLKQVHPPIPASAADLVTVEPTHTLNNL
jgi:hypothetical protein